MLSQLRKGDVVCICKLGRPAKEDYNIVAEGYLVSDLQLGYGWRNFAVGVTVQNLFNTRWKETQFATESRLQNQASPVEEIHFTPGTPFNARMSFTWRSNFRQIL